MLLYIVRHGDPNYALDCLTDRGLLQAQAVAKRLAASHINRIFSSSMGRARQTAQPLCELLGKDYEVLDWARELPPSEMHTEFPDGKRKSISRVQETTFRENGLDDLSYADSLTCPGFNTLHLDVSFARLTENGYPFLERLGYRHENGVFRIVNPNEERIALFCHAGFARAWLSMLLHIPPHLMWADFAISHTGVTVLEFRNYENGFTTPKCLCLSDISHLYAQGLDTLYDNRIEL